MSLFKFFASVERILYPNHCELLADVIGICQQTSDIQNLVARTTRRDLKKRDITLVDSSDASVSKVLNSEK